MVLNHLVVFFLGLGVGARVDCGSAMVHCNPSEDYSLASNLRAQQNCTWCWIIPLFFSLSWLCSSAPKTLHCCLLILVVKQNRLYSQVFAETEFGCSENQLLSFCGQLCCWCSGQHSVAASCPSGSTLIDWLSGQYHGFGGWRKKRFFFKYKK